jgi:hypothetical protein
MKSGALQATVLSPEESLVAQKMGYGILLDFIEKGIEFPHVNVVAREDYLETQTQTVRGFMRAYIESVRYYKTQSCGSRNQNCFSEQTTRPPDGRNSL